MRASQPRTSPYSRPVAGAPSPLVPPVITMFLYTAGGEGSPNDPFPPSTLTLAFRSTDPPVPKSVASVPVLTSMAIIRPSPLPV